MAYLTNIGLPPDKQISHFRTHCTRNGQAHLPVRTHSNIRHFAIKSLVYNSIPTETRDACSIHIISKRASFHFALLSSPITLLNFSIADMHTRRNFEPLLSIKLRNV